MMMLLLTFSNVFNSPEDKLGESTSANAVLSAQLENISPQLASLEAALSGSRLKLKEEQKLRRQSEQAQDEADQRLRELEQSLQTLREECDDIHEELAFKENELEETRLELEVEKQQLENENNSLRATISNHERQVARQSSILETETATTNGTVDADPAAVAVDESYAKKLEEELELVTEQLIETERKLNQAESQLQEANDKILSLQGSHHADDEDQIAVLQAENAELVVVEHRLQQEIASLTEEVSLMKEEVALQQEELAAVEADCAQATRALSEQTQSHQHEVRQLQADLASAKVDSKSSAAEAALVTQTVMAANTENEQLLQQLAALEGALSNSKKDYEQVSDELLATNKRFDEAVQEAERKGAEAASDGLRAAMKTDAEHEIRVVKESLKTLSEENKALQGQIDKAELALAQAQDTANGQEQSSAVVAQLQEKLSESKEELAKKDKEMTALTASMEERLASAEEQMTNLEGELRNAKQKLAEAESHLVVLSRQQQQDTEITASPISPRGRLDLDTSLSSPSSRCRSSSPSSVMRLELRLAEEVRKYGVLEKECNELQDQKRMGEVRIKRLEDDVKTLQTQLAGDNATVVTQMSRLSSLANKQSVDLMAEQKEDSLNDILESRDVKRMVEELRAYEKKCNGQREYNAQLLSKMLHLQGNIQVYCRIRPMTVAEVTGGARNVVEALSETEVGCFDSRINKWKSFAFDRVWGPDQSQTSVFQDVEPLALSVVDGFNACIFAYGQTGSGYVTSGDALVGTWFHNSLAFPCPPQ